MKRIIATPEAGRVQQGFTLVELMVVVAIVAILAAVGYPSYTQYVIRGHRAAAQTEMMDIANRQQQLFFTNRSYAAMDAATCAATLPTEVSGRYSCAITVGPGPVPSFTIIFTATGSQASDGELTLNSIGVKTPAGKWK